MKAPCKTECGLDIDYQPVEFSDGFTYYLPRNLDGTYHDCIMLEEGWEIELECLSIDEIKNVENNFSEKFLQSLKTNSKLSLDEFIKKKCERNKDPYTVLEDYYEFEFELVPTLISGRMLLLKKEIEKQMISIPAPFYRSRSDFNTNGWFSTVKHDIDLTDATNEHIAEWVYLETPTNQGYQLEYLGKYYELMLNLEDAKKCFILQHDITGEPELKEYAEKLDRDIEEKNILYPKNNKLEKMTKGETVELIKKTEANIQKYIVMIFENNFKKIWEKFPNFKKSIEDRREIQENSTIPYEEKTPIQHLTMGQLYAIIKNSNNRVKTKVDGKCNICHTEYQKGERIFLESIETQNSKKTFSCKNEQCFAKQGGMHKSIPRELITLIGLVKDVRNPLTHSNEKDFTDAEFWDVNFSRIKSECELINLIINRELSNKELT